MTFGSCSFEFCPRISLSFAGRQKVGHHLLSFIQNQFDARAEQARVRMEAVVVGRRVSHPPGNAVVVYGFVVRDAAESPPHIVRDAYGALSGPWPSSPHRGAPPLFGGDTDDEEW